MEGLETSLNDGLKSTTKHKVGQIQRAELHQAAKGRVYEEKLIVIWTSTRQVS